jgi:beta-ureidopropionase
LISTEGKVIGKYRKNHIPPIEAPFLSPGDFDQPIFDTEFGKIGILICYERHFPLNWMMLSLGGAEIVFNPSSEDTICLDESNNSGNDCNEALSKRLNKFSFLRRIYEILQLFFRMWLIEGRNAAVANGFFTVSINRVGIESFPNGQKINYFGSTYIASPDGHFTEPLNCFRDGLLLAEIDLNACARVKQEFSFHQNQHLEKYSKKINEFLV